MKKTVITAAVLAAMAVSPMAAADEGSNYVGFGLGSTTWNLDGEDWLAYNGYSYDDSANGLKIFAGTQINENFDVEGYYAYLGEVEAYHWYYSTITADAGAAGIAVLGKLPLSSAVSIYGKVGGHFWGGEIQEAYYSETDNGIGFMFGAGVQFEGEKLFARIEVENYGLDESDIAMTSASLGFKF